MSKPPVPELITADNLSLGWWKVMQKLLAKGVTSISPLTLSITGFDADGAAAEIPGIREAVENFLVAEGKKDVENVAWTIFPQRYWEMSDGDRTEFFNMFREAFPRVQKFNAKNNARGSYFQRLVDFEGDGNGRIDQLEWILSEYERDPGRRVSKWQASTFDPRRDLLNWPQLEFPCLQQVSFTFDGEEGLIINAFYATQQLARKGYGNYLGIARLGAFMASQMKRRMVRMNVFIGVAKMDTGKADPNMVALRETVEAVLEGEEALA
jgi:hypothetical protein